MSTIGACDIGTIQLELAVEVSLSSFYAVSQILCAVGEVRTLQSFHDDINVNAMQSEQCFKWTERKQRQRLLPLGIAKGWIVSACRRQSDNR